MFLQFFSKELELTFSTIWACYLLRGIKDIQGGDTSKKS